MNLRASAQAALAMILLALAGATFASTSEEALATAGFEQRIGANLPENARFRDASGRARTLSELTAGKPMVLVLAWFDCPNLCSMILEQLARASGELPFGAEEYRVAAVSIDPQEGPADARAQQQRLIKSYGERTGQWHFLTGDADAIASVAEAVGFDYAYDAQADSFAHPAGYIVVSPSGVVSRYLFSLRPGSPDLKLALLEAGEGRLGSPLDQVVLRCYRFSPDSGQYNLAVVRLLQAAGGTFVLVALLAFWWMGRRHRGR